MQTSPSAEALSFDGGPTGLLLCHGFTGSPTSMAPWARFAANHGITVRVPLLPGHGSTWQECNRTTWHDWLDAVERELLTMTDHCSTLVIAGLSMGAALALHLAHRYPTQVHGLVLVNPAIALNDWRLRTLPVLNKVVPSLRGITDDIAKPGVTENGYSRNPLRALQSMTHLLTKTRHILPEVTQPCVVFRSRQDHVVPAISGDILLREIGSHDVRHQWLDRSYHVATLDYDQEIIFTQTHQFLTHLSAKAPHSHG